jgi:hypothetical protein
MDNNASQEKPKISIQTIFVLGVLILFPVISFMVNLKGAEAGKNFYKDIKQNLGQIPAFEATNWQNEILNSNIYKGKVRVVSFTDNENREAVLKTMLPIVKTEQFREEVENLIFLNFDMANDSVFFKPFIEKFTPKDRKLWQILRGGNDLPSQMKLPNTFNVSLVDTAGVIRRFYDVRNEDDRRMLVEHIAIMPIKKKQQVEKIERKQR